MQASELTDDQVVELAEMFRLMGDPSRLKIIAACLQAPTCISDIAAKYGLSQTLVSHHLRLLRAARVLRAERRGKQIFYAVGCRRLDAHGPDPLTRQIARLAAHDEARHVALGMSHLLYRLEEHEPALRMRLAQAVEHRNDTLAATAGLNEKEFDALILAGASELTPAGVARGYAHVQQLIRDMADGRYARLARLGFEREHAKQLASLHTRNFM
jgi:DNA-binding transcriptional ArsR family regulator